MRYNRPTLGKADIDKHVNQPHGTRNDREKQLKNKHRLAYRRQGGSHEGEKRGSIEWEVFVEQTGLKS